MSAGEFLGQLLLPEAFTETKFLVVSASCKGVPLVKEDAARVAAFESAKKNPGNRRMATVSRVYTLDPHVRSAEEIAAAFFRDETEPDPDRPKRPWSQNKNTTAHLSEAESDGEGSEVVISTIHVAMAWLIGHSARVVVHSEGRGPTSTGRITAKNAHPRAVVGHPARRNLWPTANAGNFAVSAQDGQGISEDLRLLGEERGPDAI